MRPTYICSARARSWRKAPRGLALAAALALLGLSGRSVSRADAPVALFHADPDIRSQCAADLRKAGLEVDEVDAPSLERISPETFRLMVIAPDTAFPPESRRRLSEYLAAGGHVMCLSSQAFNYSPAMRFSQALADFSSTSGLSIRRPQDADTSETLVTLPDGERGIEFRTSHVGAGAYEASVPLQSHRSGDRTIISVRAKGGPDLEIIRLKITDDSGRNWAAFINVDRQWRTYVTPFANFRPLTAGKKAPTNPDELQLDPERIARLAIGVEPSVMWSEQPGSFGVATLELGTADRYAGVPTSELLRWRKVAEKGKIDCPEWILDPFFASREIDRALSIRTAPTATFLESATFADAAHVRATPPPLAIIGESRDVLAEVLSAHDVRRVPLLEATDAKSRRQVVLAELVLPGNGRAASDGAVAAFGLPLRFYRAEPDLWNVVAATAKYLIDAPKIVGVHPNISAPLDERKAETIADKAAQSDNEIRVTCRVQVVNPRTQDVEAAIKATVSGGLTWRGAATLAAGKTTDVLADLGSAPDGFPVTRFEWSVRLSEQGGEHAEWDRMSDAVDAERTLLRAATLLVANQQRHADGRFSHHFFADVYGARALLQAATYFSQADAAKRNAELLAGCPPATMRAAALRFCDMLVERQRPDGGLPLGYFEDKGWIFVADGGQLSLGLMQLAGQLEASDPIRSRNYIEAAKRFMEFRQSFRQDETTAERLQAKYGANSPGIRAGDYGLGLMGFDFYSKEKWGEVRPEMRGPFWVLGCSMPTAAALATQTGEQRWFDLVRTDVTHYLQCRYSLRSHFQSEAAHWIYLALDDQAIRGQLRRQLIEEAVPELITGREHAGIEHNGRAILRWLPLEYCRDAFGDSTAARAAVIKALWDAGSESSSYSVHGVAQLLPGGGYYPAIAANRYACFTAIVLAEMLAPQSTLLPKHRTTP